MTVEGISGCEVLDGEWITGWEAIEHVTETLARYGTSTPMAAGEILARMAATGYLPTISDDRSHTQKISDNPDAVPAGERNKSRDEGWHIVPVQQWAATFGLCLVDGKHIQHAQCDFMLSAMTVIYTSEKMPPNAMLHEVMSDPGFYMTMSRNILFYSDAIYAVTQFVRGYPSDDLRFQYNKIDLTRLNLPSETPVEAMERSRLAFASQDVEGDEITESSPRPKGRPGGKNGEPIATLTIRLMTLPMDQFSRCTAESAGVELQQLFEISGVGARNADNCKKDAAGVLRVVRAARGADGKLH